MELGAHTMTHPHLGVIAGAAQAHEISGSLECIERRAFVRPVGFAYPGGDYGAETLEVVANAGLEYAVTTQAGVNTPGAQRFELRRRSWSDGACLGPNGVFSTRLARAELDGAFDRLRAERESAA
jgi:peptidoglycan/xylan/chitin deacetylase (PgdA/CDA1 family)